MSYSFYNMKKLWNVKEIKARELEVERKTQALSLQIYSLRPMLIRQGLEMKALTEEMLRFDLLLALREAVGPILLMNRHPLYQNGLSPQTIKGYGPALPQSLTTRAKWQWFRTELSQIWFPQGNCRGLELRQSYHNGTWAWCLRLWVNLPMNSYGRPFWNIWHWKPSSSLLWLQAEDAVNSKH